VLTHAAQVGNDVTITASAVDVLTLKRVKLTGLQSGDFQFAQGMIRKSGYRFSEKIMLKQKDRAG
jgi:hypothetical protein